MRPRRAHRTLAAAPATGVRCARRRRGATLIEIIIAIGLVALLMGGAALGLGMYSGARLKSSVTMVAGAIRIAYNHANATSRPTRLVFDFGQRSLRLEESSGKQLLQTQDRTGGAVAASDAEHAALEEAESIVEGPRAPRASFSPVAAMGIETEDGRPGKQLEPGISFRQIEVEHESDPITEDIVYLYFWPGGQTERASIQIQRGDGLGEGDVLTLLVSPLTGKVTLERGALEMLRPIDDEDASEREDRGF